MDWRGEIAAVVSLLLVLLLLGFWAGNLSLVLLVGTFSYLAWHLYQLIRLQRWLSRPKLAPQPHSIGLWRSIVENTDKLRDRGRRRKRKLSRVLNGFQESTSALPDATVVLDDEGRVEWWNGVAAEVLCIERQHKGVRIDTLLRDPVFKIYLSDGDYSRPLQMPAPVSDSVTLEVRVVPYGKGKRLLQARDITRLHQLETVRRDFVANVSHEMRTPLTVVQGYLESMCDRRDNGLEPWNRILDQMHQQTSRMRRIVEDLLLLSRLETQQGIEGQEPVEISNLLLGIESEARGLSGGNHSITLDTAEGPEIIGTSAELESAFSNLVFNAVRYTPAGGEIRMRWWLDGENPCFSVSDTGIGIESEHIPRLTERFYRVDVGRSRQSGGTGLGLAIVKHVLTRHGGHLEVESEIGKGSTFTCRFPPSRAVSREIQAQLG